MIKCCFSKKDSIMGKYGTIDISNFRKASDISFTAIEKAMATYLIYEDINNKGYRCEPGRAAGEGE